MNETNTWNDIWKQQRLIRIDNRGWGHPSTIWRECETLENILISLIETAFVHKQMSGTVLKYVSGTKDAKIA